MLFRPIFLCIAGANAADLLNYGAFTQTATYSIANQLGFFSAYNLNVVYQQVPNSTFAYAQVLNGGYDILTGTIDNAVNLRFNSNKTVTVLGQLDQGPDLVLASSPKITSVDQLKGKPLIVDSPVSGYAYLLRKVLSSYGLLLENGDYFFQVNFLKPSVYMFSN
jgi:ABC-type nitrate/sulfonate/bicarbonate transport system substrate-binding protein